MAILDEIVKTQGGYILKLRCFLIKLCIKRAQRSVGYFSKLYLQR